jgi:anti-sigma B factor antagonist
MTNHTAIDYHVIENKPNTAIIKLGEYVLGGNDALDFSSMLEQLGSTEVKYVVVDLQQVKLMNSSGLGMLVSGLSLMKRLEKTFMLASIPPKVANLLQITHLNDVFKSFETVEQAVECSK